MSKAILHVVLLLVVSAACDYRLDRMGPTQEMCSDNFIHLVLEGIDECSEQDCAYSGPSNGFMAVTCNATVELFNKTLIQFGSGRNFSIEWQFKDATCKEVNVVDATAVASCEGAPSLDCQSGHIDTCVYVQPTVPQGLPPIVTEPPIPPPTPVPVAEVPVTPPTHQTGPLAEPLASPVDAPLAQQQAPKAQETALTPFEKFIVGVSTSGWGVALVFIVLYLYLRQKNKGHNYVPLVEEHEESPPRQPTVITSDNKNALKPILQDTKSRIPNIPASELIIDKTKKLGEGQACQVYEGLWRQKRVAIKIPRDRDATKVMKELIVRSEIDPHPNIVEVYGYFEYEDRICLVLELCNCPNLEKLAKQDLSLSDKFAIAVGIASGILHLHHSKRQVIHRDLKPSNILVAKSGSHLIPKIADFDYSRLLSSPKGVTMSTPTTSYAAPEQLAASANAKKEYSVKSDAWAYGAILFYLLTGQTPFAVQNTNALKTQRLNKQALVRFELLDTLPVDPFTSLLVDITRKCLNDDPNKRPMFDRIDNEFADFFNKFYPRGQNNNANLQ